MMHYFLFAYKVTKNFSNMQEESRKVAKNAKMYKKIWKPQFL